MPLCLPCQSSLHENCDNEANKTSLMFLAKVSNSFPIISLKQKCCYFDEISVTDWNESYTILTIFSAANDVDLIKMIFQFQCQFINYHVVPIKSICLAETPNKYMPDFFIIVPDWSTFFSQFFRMFICKMHLKILLQNIGDFLQASVY